MSSSAAIIETLKRIEGYMHSSNEFEAAAAANKFQDILFKHNLSLEEYHRQKENGTGDYVQERTFMADGAWDWRGHLLNALAANNFCRLLSSGRSHIVVGKRHNIEVVLFMYEYLHGELVRLSPAAWERQKALDMIARIEGAYVPKRSPAKYRDSFLAGAVHTISERLHAKAEELRTANEESTALVVISNSELDQAMAKMFPNLRYTRARRSKSIDSAGFSSGRSFGERVGLVTQPRADFNPGTSRKQLA